MIGATGINTSSQYAQALNTVAGTKFKIVLGYPGATEMGLALERGEIGGYTNTWAGWVGGEARLAARQEDHHPRPDRPRCA